MATPRLCKFYRDYCRLYSDSESTDSVQDIGYCDLDCDRTTCKGDIDLCQKSDSLKRYFFEQIKRGGVLEWERRINVPFSEDLKT